MTHDWSAYDGKQEYWVTCKCWHIYRSHASILGDEKHWPRVMTRKACPKCGKDTDAMSIATDNPKGPR